MSYLNPTPDSKGVDVRPSYPAQDWNLHANIPLEGRHGLALVFCNTMHHQMNFPFSSQVSNAETRLPG